ncbi:cation transporter [Candidatus Roizmanbacteria bacterium]|nr:MAG: cation transporter [Candidatus Roizmanbacteria bacterium]
MKTATCTYFVSGMHCGSCEVLLQKISKLKGVSDVKASLQDGSVQISYHKGHKPQVSELNDEFSELGYFSPNRKQYRTDTKHLDSGNCVYGAFRYFVHYR